MTSETPPKLHVGGDHETASPVGTSGGLRARCHCQTPDGTALGAGSEGGHLGRPPGAVGALGARECEKGVSDTLRTY